MFKINNFKLFQFLPKTILNTVQPNLGNIPDDFDEKDWIFEHNDLFTIPCSGSISIKNFFKEISHQYHLGSCTANAVADACEAKMVKDNKTIPGKIKDLSRLFIYWNARNLDRPPKADKDKGSKIKLALDSVRIYGIPFEKDYPYMFSRVNKQPGWLVYKKAIKNKFKTFNFYKITSKGQERRKKIQQALFYNCPVVFGTSVTEEFRKVRNANIIQKPKGGFIGKHAMIIVGWSEELQAYHIRNSWGTAWGDKGYGYMSKKYIESTITKDLWVIL